MFDRGCEHVNAVNTCTRVDGNMCDCPTVLLDLCCLPVRSAVSVDHQLREPEDNFICPNLCVLYCDEFLLKQFLKANRCTCRITSVLNVFHEHVHVCCVRWQEWVSEFWSRTQDVVQMCSNPPVDTLNHRRASQCCNTLIRELFNHFFIKNSLIKNSLTDHYTINKQTKAVITQCFLSAVSLETSLKRTRQAFTCLSAASRGCSALPDGLFMQTKAHFPKCCVKC